METISEHELQKEIRTPRPLGIVASLFLTVGILLLQLFFFSVVILVGKLAGVAGTALMMGMMLLGSLIWVACAYYLQRVLRLPPFVLSISVRGLSIPVMLLLIPFAFLMQVAGGSLDSIILTFYPSHKSSLDQFQNMVLNFPLSLIFLLLLTIVVAPLSEELYFRGLLFRGMRVKGLHVFVAALATGLIFALVHLQIVGMVTLTLVGLSCAYLSHKSRSLFYSVWLHGVYNAMVMGFSFTVFFVKAPEFYTFGDPLPSTGVVPDPLWANLLRAILFGGAAMALLFYTGSKVVLQEGSAPEEKS
ncbi:CPBP family intramembrane metalloprotease [Myxococcota bacterium]|nr:CPBP family intramembrane metalloprotease [Myxococcota bacterium]MBU1534447.1 CPBP family intramembrane metalloprotease [Myxococcota bacterium]